MTRRRQRGLAALVALCVASALGTAAHAAPPRPGTPRVVAVVDGTGDADGGVLAGRLATALEPDDGLQGLGDEARARALVAPLADESGALIVDARAALDQARDAVARFDDANALGATSAGQTRLLGARPTPVVRALLADLVLTEGLARLGGGDQAGALAAFAAVHRLDPARTLDPARFPPDVLAVYDRAGAAAPTSATIAIDVDGAATEVWIDGTSIGAPPTTAAVAPGVHFVAVTGPDTATAGARIVVVADARAPLRLVAAPASEAVRLARLRRRLLDAADGAARDAAIGAIARAVGTTAAAVVLRQGDGLAVQLWQDGAPLGEPVTYTRQTARELVLPLAPPRPLIAPPIRRPDPPPSPAWWQRRWVRVVAATGAAVLVGGAITLSLGRDPGSSAVTNGGFR